ncbi:MAG: PQQ-binding-like beta-propeller repeat protein, partial [Candidatus Micrarchaeia archaeon]
MRYDCNVTPFGFLFLFSFILLSSFSFSSFFWTTSLSLSQQNENAITSQPLVMGTNIIVASQQGYLYSLASLTGNQIWSKQIGGYLTQPVLFDDLIVVGSSNGIIIALKKDGTEKWNVSINGSVYGLTVSDKVYATTKNGVYAIGKSGSSDLIYNTSSTKYTAPASDENVVVFAIDRNLVEINKNGKEIWNREIANFWESAPVIDNNVIFIGALDDSMYAIQKSDGSQIWRFATNGWVLSTAKVDGSSVYFGSNDGNIYSVGIFDGKLKWRYQTNGAIEGTPAIAILAGQKIVLAGSNDNNIYAIDSENGNLLFSKKVKSWVYSPIAIGKSVIFGSHDGNVYSLSAERACMIETPVPDSKVSYREVTIGGKVFSEYESPDVYVRINGADWQKAETANESWAYLFDPSKYELGIIQIECKASDAGGEENEPYTLISIVRTENEAIDQIRIEAPASVKDGEEFTITASDNGGAALQTFEVEF